MLDARIEENQFKLNLRLGLVVFNLITKNPLLKHCLISNLLINLYAFQELIQINTLRNFIGWISHEVAEVVVLVLNQLVNEVLNFWSVLLT